MHDIGKIGIPDNILMKPGKLTPAEWEVMKTHAEIGANIIGGYEIKSPLLDMARRLAGSHHEKWDGSGYPLGLSGEDIPIEGRITAIADVFDALVSKRVYKQSWSIEEAIEHIKSLSGTQFDPAIVSAFLAIKSEIIVVLDTWPE